MPAATFEVIEPLRGETPLVVEVPHAGLAMDAVSMALCTAPVRSVSRDADLYVDELVADASDEGATVIAAKMSRYVVDLNRDPDETDRLAVEGGAAESRPWGLVWRSTTGGDDALTAPVCRAELERRLDLVYWPYHRALEAIVTRKLRRFSVAVVLSMHSMPSDGGTDKEADTRRRVADVVIGTHGQTTASRGLIALADRSVRAGGWSVAHDDPYAGGATTRRWGQPGRGIHAIQIEIARRAYLDEPSCRRNPAGFEAVRFLCRGLVARLGAAALP